MRRVVFFLTLLVTIVNQARALTPDEIAILAVKSNDKSRELAEYYAQARGVPKSQICLLEIPAGETLSRNDWELRVRPAIRRWLVQNKLEAKIRCFVTVWDVPLKIAAVDSKHPVLAELQTHLSAQRRTRQEQILRLAKELDQLLVVGDPPERTPPTSEAAHKEWADFLEAAMKDAQSRALSAQGAAPTEVAAAAAQLERLYKQGGGNVALLRSMQEQLKESPQPPLELVRSFEFHRGELAGQRLAVATLSGLRESVERDLQTLTVLQKSDGLLGALSYIEQTAALWKKNETYSSFDSELSLIYSTSYPLMRWQNNASFYGFNSLLRESLPWTLMVSRLEAPTFEAAKRIIDDAIEIERTGLSGKVYLDARGMPREKEAGPGSYGDFDQSLRDLAAFLKEHTQLEVILDNRDTLFQKGDCPDAALYCGWYSLSKYVDAFEWKRGSVGYHMASGEAETLRNAKSQVWCKRMLEEGVSATIGPVYEPYLASFPRPLDFFPLLLTGKYTLAEVYARTNPFSSWVQVLVGDPLYNPFKNNPQFDEHDPPEIVRNLMRDRW